MYGFNKGRTETMIDIIDIQLVIRIAKDAGDAILEVYNKDFEVEHKADNSPLTEADQKSNDIIIEGLKSAYPDIPLISEESKEIPYDERKGWEYFWLIDPLDGTKEFVKKNGEFTVNIALIQGNHPVLGVVYVPVQEVTYYGSEGNGSYKIEANGETSQIQNTYHYSDKQRISIVASRSHLSDAVIEFVEQQKELGKQVELLSAGSSLKLCLVAEGKADVYPRLGPTMEWDTAAAHAVVNEAGRNVLQYESNLPLIYNKENLLNPWFIVE